MDSLTTDYLKDVMGKMEVYGDRVQFGLTSPGPRPYYQVTNTAEKKMAFDSNHHLLHPKEDEFVGVNSTRYSRWSRSRRRLLPAASAPPAAAARAAPAAAVAAAAVRAAAALQ
ncbi:hypothetical protein CAter10_0068 [Collimonas arenae]|uniref:hypothetical protein n=1 Tax=Collimonas arenae TaxID=279058 RepID=UPI00078B811B|nr:hypothetical protein [Collimonas arenae]AMO98027.1 hypothetical protein CAter10_0068 [Collimonas arenae]